MEVKVLENLMKANDDFAQQVRAFRRERALPMLNLIGGPGCGKTTLLERMLKYMRRRVRVAVIEGDQSTARDAERIAAAGGAVVQINTGGGCHLNANQVLRGLQELDLDGVDLVVVENVGNLVCPAEFDLGEDAKIAMISVPEGGDKPGKYPLLFREAGAVLVSKKDLDPYVDFDSECFSSDLKRLNAMAPVFELSATTGLGLHAWFQWVESFVANQRSTRGAAGHQEAAHA